MRIYYRKLNKLLIFPEQTSIDPSTLPYVQVFQQAGAMLFFLRSDTPSPVGPLGFEPVFRMVRSKRTNQGFY